MKLHVRSDRREQMIDVTRQVADALAQASVQDGVVVVYVSHTTAGVTINENADPDVVTDLLAGLARLAPCDAGWRHCEGNSDAHLKASLMGSSVTVPVAQGRMQLGTWQGIYFCEFDGPRTREIEVVVMGA